MGFKEREREGRIELDQVEGRGKASKFQQFEIATKVSKIIFVYKISFYYSFGYVLHYIDMALIYQLHDYFI